MTDLEVEFDVTAGFDALEAPDKLPTVFNGDKTVIYGIFRSKAVSDSPLEAGLSGTATLKGKILGETFEHTIPFQIPPPSESLDSDSDSFQVPVVHCLAAKSLIRDWEHKEGWASTASESECKKEIIRVSIESSVVSSHTAYIAVDEEQDKPIEGAIQMWDLSATMAADQQGGWGYSALGLGAGAARGVKYKKARNSGGGLLFGGPPPPAAPMGFGGPPPGATAYYASAAPAMNMFGGGGLGGGPPPPPPPAGGVAFGGFSGAPPPPAFPAASMGFGGPPQPQVAGSMGFGGGLQMQSAPPTSFAFATGPPPPPPPTDTDLLFDSAPRYRSKAKAMPRAMPGAPATTTSKSSDELTQLISLQQAEGFWTLDNISKFVKKSIANPFPGISANIWATAVALVLLESRFSSQADEWELVAMKAELWLDSQSLPGGIDTEKLKEEARKLI